MAGIVERLQSDVRFGLTLYSAEGPETCPILTKVPLALTNYDAINAVYSKATWIDNTPTGESIAQVAADLATVQEPGPKIIVLATDGEPDTCLESSEGDEAKVVSVNAVKAAFDGGIQTFVISVGSDIAESHLRDLANVGQGFPTADATKRYFLTNSQLELENAFKEIIYGTRTCTFTLNGEVEPAHEASGSIILGGAALTYQDPDGWKLNDPSEVELLGEACMAVKTSDPTLQISFPCGSFKPAPIVR